MLIEIFLSAGGLTLTHGADVPGESANMSVAACTTACKALNYPLAGIEYAGECCKSVSIMPLCIC